MRYSRTLLICIAVLVCGVSYNARSAIFWLDGRVPFAEAKNSERLGLLLASGAIFCKDGTIGSGFVVDISEYVEAETEISIIATTARVLYQPGTGNSRGECAYRPASAPHRYLRLGERLTGSRRSGHLDSDDWAFAVIDTPFASLGFGRIKFLKEADFSASSRYELWAAGYAPEWDSVAVASGCKSDSGLSYASLWRQKSALANMIIHNCDMMTGARGGPLAIRRDDEFLVAAINAGSSREENYKDLHGIPYDPQRNFFNYSRRFDTELEDKLVAFISRFTYVKSPSEGIRAQNELIESIQENLNRLGFDSGDVDGLIGEKTEEAIKAFQTTLGITPTGQISEELLLLLKSKKKTKN